MAVSKSYPRLKSATTNTTGIAITLKAAEGAITQHAFRDNMGADEDGLTGVINGTYMADANESGGADVQDLFRFSITPNIESNGRTTLTVVVTPVKGNGDAGDAVTTVHVLPENMDAWQTAAGRARQA